MTVRRAKMKPMSVWSCGEDSTARLDGGSLRPFESPASPTVS
jgi:hypothetical protein